jgi:hypothetical protein
VVGPVLFLGALIVVPLLLQMALLPWARWLKRSREAPGWVAIVALVLVCVATLSALFAFHGLHGAFAAVSTAAPERKATLLAQGISEGMNGSMFVSVLSLVNAAWLLAWTLRSPARPRVEPPQAGEQP